jgi:exosortase/archaeosortase family protein
MAASPFATFSADSSASSRSLWRFGLVCGSFLLLWMVGSAYGLGASSPLDDVLCRQLAAGSAGLLRLLGWQAGVSASAPNMLVLNGLPAVWVGGQCDGLVLYVLLTGFVLAYPGPARRRLWFIPLGIAALWLLNVVRIVALALNHRYSPETFEFNHHYAFNAVAYAALGGLWMLWTRQSLPAAPATASSPAASLAPARTWLTARSVAGGALLVVLVLLDAFHDRVIGVFGTVWAAMLAGGPSWLRQLPGAAAGDVPNGVSHLALPVGMAYLLLFLILSLLALLLLLPARARPTIWRCYGGIGLACILLALVGWVAVSPMAYRLSRLLLDFLTSVLPVAGLLVLLWRPFAPAKVPATSQ